VRLKPGKGVLRVLETVARATQVLGRAPTADEFWCYSRLMTGKTSRCSEMIDDLCWSGVLQKVKTGAEAARIEVTDEGKWQLKLHGIDLHKEW